MQYLFQVLVALANRHKRATPTLKLLARKLSDSDDSFNIKKLSDILYSMATLTFYDEVRKPLETMVKNNLL